MPEELGIIIVLIVALSGGAVWLLIKVFEGLESGVDEVQKYTKRLRLDRFDRLKEQTSAAVSLSLPKGLERAEKRIKIAEIEFKQFQETSKWIPQSPHWSRHTFMPRMDPEKIDSYTEMDVG